MLREKKIIILDQSGKVKIWHIEGHLDLLNGDVCCFWLRQVIVIDFANAGSDI